MVARLNPGHVAPAWFSAAIGHSPEHLEVEVEGCRIKVRAWGDRGLPALVLVHGGGAHSGWWDHIAPFFSATHRVVAPDLSGHGDSGTRSAYDERTWAQEVVASAEAADGSGRPIIVGHSLGGWVAASAATYFGDRINSIVVIDSPLRDRPPEEGPLRGRRHDARGYATKDEIVARFRLVPPQAVVLPYIRSHIALASVRRTTNGWVWKFDPTVFEPRLNGQMPADDELLEDMLTTLPCRVAYLRCEGGLVTQVMARRIRSTLQLRGPFIELAEAGHHPMFDQPLALVASLRTLLELWSIT